MVVTSAPSACTARILHDFTARPFMWTVQAPHCAVSQPTCVPVSLRCSRSSSTSRVWGSTLTVTGAPLTDRLRLIAMGVSLGMGAGCLRRSEDAREVCVGGRGSTQ